MNVDEIIKQACEKPTLKEALVFTAIVETERCIDQNKLGDGGYDSCFGHLFTRVVSEYGREMNELGNAIEICAECIGTGCIHCNHLGKVEVMLAGEEEVRKANIDNCHCCGHQTSFDRAHEWLTRSQRGEELILLCDSCITQQRNSEIAADMRERRSDVCPHCHNKGCSMCSEYRQSAQADIEPVCQCNINFGHTEDCLWKAWKDRQ